MQPVPEATRRRSDLQGVRALAVGLVVLSHAGVSFLQGGFIGVDVFFVLSGFLITGLLLREAETQRAVSFLAFYSRRARRILPSATLTLVATDIAAFYLLNVVRAKQTVLDSVSAALFVVNIRFANEGTDYFAQGQPPSPIRQFWSLAVEEQFYVVWPALFSITIFGIVLHRRRRGRPHRRARVVSAAAVRRLLIVLTIVGVASFAWSVYQTDVVPASAFFATLTRVWELALGAGLAIGASLATRLPDNVRATMGWLGLGAILGAAVLFSPDTPFPGYAALLPTLGAALVIAAGISASPARLGPGRLLGLAPLRYLGDRSYTLYLWHWPILVIAAQHAGHDLSVGTNLLLVAGAFLLSIISYKFFENPIRHARWRPPARALWLAPASVLLVFIVAGLARHSIDIKTVRDASATAPSPFTAPAPSSARAPAGTSNVAVATLPQVASAVRAARRAEGIPAGLTPPVSGLLADYFAWPSGCSPDSGQTNSNVCRLGSRSAKRTLVVMGDSHSQMYGPAILPMASRDGWVVIPLMKSGLIPLMKSGCNPHTWTGKLGSAECRGWYKWAIGKAKSLRPDVVLLTGAYSGSIGDRADGVVSSMDASLTALKQAAKHTIIVGDTPRQSKQPVDCLLAANATMKTCTSTWSGTQLEASDSLAALAEVRGATYLDTTGWFCARSECPMVVGGSIVYFDTGHLTKTYVQRLAAPFRAAFRQAIGAPGSR